MGYNIEYIGKFSFVTSFIAEVILKDLRGKDLNKIKDFPKFSGYGKWFELETGGTKIGSDDNLWKESTISSQEIAVRDELEKAKQRIAELEKMLELRKPKPPRSRVRCEHEVDEGSGHFLDYGG